MKFLDAVAIFVESAEPLIRDTLAHEARETIRKTLAAYDALEPTAEDWPDGAQHFTIDAAGARRWHSQDPTPVDHQWQSAGADWTHCASIPDVIACTDCKWTRPQEAPAA